MEDDELQAIRAKRMAQMRGASGGGEPGGGGMAAFPGGMPGAAGGVGGGKDDDEKRAQMEEMRRAMMTQVLDNEARERLARISIVKPEKARGVEDLLIRMAQTGQIRGKVNEKMLIDLLEQINDGKTESKVKISRRRMDDSDDEDLLSGL